MKSTRRLTALFSALLLASQINLRAADRLISTVDFWLYQDNGFPQPPTWTQTGFDDFGWNIGVSEFGFGEGDEFTLLNPSINTAYFRTFLSHPNVGAYSNLTVRMIRDDGVVVYVNGVEVFRNNMPAGPVSYATSALRNLDGADEFSIAQRVIPATVLVNGLNTLAVEIHQAAGGNEDMSFAMELIGHRTGENQPPSANPSFVALEQDQSAALTLDAFDRDGDPLEVTILSGPMHGTLSGSGLNVIYTPNPGYFGPDLFSFMASDGEWNTEVAEVIVEVMEVSNRPPTANAQSVAIAEDNGLIIILEGSDPDGDELAYTYAAAAHGLLSGTGNVLFYQPATNYFGPDSFTFTVDDGKGGTSTATVLINVTPVNDAPIAQAGVALVSDPSNFENSLVAIAINNQNVRVILDASSSGDVEGNALSYAWYLGTTVVSTEANAIVSLPVGNHVLTLVVSDGAATASDTASVEVFTPCDLVQTLVNQVKVAALKPSQRNGLLGHLNAACSTFGNGNVAAGVHQLELFQTRVVNKIAPHDPALALALSNGAQSIIDEISGP